MNAPGKNFLKVTGILYLIIHGFDMLIVLLGMDNASLGSKLEAYTSFPLPVLLFNDLCGIFVGIMGIAYCSTLEKAKVLTGIAIIVLVWDVVFLIADFSWSSLIFLFLPILYLIGAVKNKNVA